SLRPCSVRRGARSSCRPSPAARCAASLARASGTDDAQGSIGLGEHAAPGWLDDHVVFDPHAPEARDVDPRLDGANHPRLEHGLRSRIETGIFVSLEADAVADPMKEMLAVPGRLDDPPSRGVDFSGGGFRPHRFDRRVMGFEHEPVYRAMLLARPADP